MAFCPPVLRKDDQGIEPYQGLAATIADIAAEAAISHGLAYHYFTNKETLFQALVEHTLQERRTALQRFQETPLPPGERLDFLLTRLIENQRNHPEVAQLHEQVQNAEATPPALREQARQVNQELLTCSGSSSLRARPKGQLLMPILTNC